MTRHTDQDQHEVFEPAYLGLRRSGELAKRARLAAEHLKDCDLCARYCHVNRLEGIEGAVCRTGEKAVLHSFGPHLGEELPLRGSNGSGTIFFSWCNLRCQYCQNWNISHKGHGYEVSAERLADIMLELQQLGCHNINFVSPSHVVVQILAAVAIAAGHGLHIPLVYNTGGYDSPEALQLLDGVIDIYMPDMKYGSTEIARKYSRVRDYVRFNQMAVKEMHRQVGDLVLDAHGIAKRGLLVRHLVLPNDLACSTAVLEFIASEVSANTYINIMDQYHPCYRADSYPELNRRLRPDEFAEVLRMAASMGLERLDQRHLWRL